MNNLEKHFGSDRLPDLSRKGLEESINKQKEKKAKEDAKADEKGKGRNTRTV